MNFRSFKNVLATIGTVLAMGFATSASAGCIQGCEMVTPPVPNMGITVQGWVNSGAVGIGQTTGTGKKVTGEVVTVTDEMFTLGANTFLTGNANPACVGPCQDSGSTLSIIGSSRVGAASVGYAQNDGGCASNSCAPTSSVSQTGTNAIFRASLMQTFRATAAP